MGMFSGVRQSITPVTANDNYTLHAATGELGIVLAISATGEATASTAMSTRWASTLWVGSTIVTGNAQRHGIGTGLSNTPAQAIDFATGWTTQPNLPTAQSYFPSGSWNALGGSLYWRSAGEDESIIIYSAGAATNFCCRNSTGTGVSSYSVLWRE